MTKSQVNKVGKSVRRKLREGEEITEEELLKIQEFRTSFKEDLSAVFKVLQQLVKKQGRQDSIVSFRVKRIESILSKIKREPTMALGNMGDIAGCRIIVYSEAALKELVKQVHNTFEVVNENDYTVTPKPDGYRGYHLYIKSPINDFKQVEIQLRFIRTHRWASLVEMIDIIYNLKLKEGQKHEKLERFIKVLSKDANSLSVAEMTEVMDLDREFKVYSSLNEVFLKNHLSIRQKWLSLKQHGADPYFIFEVDENNQSSITAFDSYEPAEELYYEMFKLKRKSNFVLASIEKATFKKLCVAYASYMMITHEYLKDWNIWASKILEYSIKKKQRAQMEQVLKDYIHRNLNERQDQLNQEIEELSQYMAANPKDIDDAGIEEWREELKSMVQEISGLIEVVKTAKKRIPEPSLLRKILGG